MNSPLDVEITRAMTELADAAPMARSIDALVPPPDRTPPRRRGMLVGAAAVLLIAAGGVVWTTSGRESRERLTPASPTSQGLSTDSSFEEPPTTAAAFDAGLPDDLVVWNIGYGAVLGSRHAEQLFGELDPSGATFARGVLVTSTLADGIAPGTSPTGSTILIRGTSGVTDVVAGTPVVQWIEQDIRYDAYSASLSTEQIVAALDPMLLRSDGLSFDPSTAPPDLPLVVESESNAATLQRNTYIHLGPVGEPNLELAGEAEPRVTVSEWSASSQSPAMIIALGTKQPDGSYEAPIVTYLPDQKMARFVLEPGDSVVTINANGAAQRQAILDAFKGWSTTDLNTLRDDASVRLAELPELMRTALTTGTIVLRGGTLEKPTAICLTIDDRQACRIANLATPNGPAAKAVIDGVWYFFGVDSDVPQALVDCTNDWPTSAPLSAAVQRDTISAGGRTWWISEIPPESTCIRIGRITDNTIDLTSVTGSVRPR